MPALQIFVAPWIFIDLMSDMILLNFLELLTFFFISRLGYKTLKRFFSTWYHAGEML